MDHRAALMGQASCKSLEKTVATVISKKEESILSAINAVYWLAKENIATNKYPSLLELRNRGV